MEAVEKQIFQIQSESDFQAIALKIFHFQYKTVQSINSMSRVSYVR